MSILSSAEITVMQATLDTTFNTTVEIDRQVETNAQRGGYALSWNAVLTTDARRTDLSGAEQLRAMQVTSTQMKRFHITPTTVALDTSMRLVDLGEGGKAYNIRDISTPGPIALMTVLLCESIAGSPGA